MLLSFISFIFTLMATSIMSYISLATPIGPWIEATLVLVGLLFFPLLKTYFKMPKSGLGLATAAGGVGGIIATACGFSFPTLYFLDQQLFNSYLAQPLSFIGLMAGLVLAAGLFGYFIAVLYEETLFAEPGMVFSVGQMTAKMLDAQQSMRKAVDLAVGFSISLLFSIAQRVSLVIPQKLTLVPKLSLGIFRLPALIVRMDLMPMLFALGFVTGHVLALPLLVGVITKWFLIDPLHYLYVPELSIENIVLAFCSGLMVQGAISSLVELPTSVISAYKRMMKFSPKKSDMYIRIRTLFTGIELIVGGVCIIGFLWWYNFSVIEQLYLLIFTFICTYQLMVIGGKIGLAPLGRFATFVMLPGLFIFGYHPLKIMVMAAFVEIAGGVAVDVLFGRKMGQLEKIDHRTMGRFQLLGLLAAACAIGGIFWLLITHFGLGSTELFAQRAQARALLIQAFHFDYRLLIIGVVYGFVLRFIKVNPLLVLGGLSMPVDFSLVLIAGGLATYLVTDKEYWYPFWSGIFAASSLWMLIKAFGL